MSKGLEALKRFGDIELHNPFLEEPRLIKTKNSKAYGKEYKVIEELLKALEILRTKRVQLDTLFSIFTYHKEKENSVQLTLYNSCVGFPERKLTQKEYDLLKEVLKDE